MSVPDVRDLRMRRAGSFAVVTGQDVRGELPGGLERIARAVDTLVVLMPVSRPDEISARLVPVLGDDRPAAPVSDATTANQRVLRTTLCDIAAAAQAAGIAAPPRWCSGTPSTCSASRG
ncbi:MAG: hypothetical protein M3019_02050 [Candidatus Dormibacteraeota bacterium]|nr:hypothetical protein [Candidatus Dormibacteraeota bacterium]